MDQNSNSAEKELLKAIEGEESLEAKSQTKAVPDIIGLVKSRWAFAYDKLKKRVLQNGNGVDIALVNKAIGAVIGILIIWGILIAVKGAGRLHNIPRFDISKLSSQIVVSSSIKLPVKEYAYYVDVLLGRNIFNPEQKEEAQVQMVVPRINEIVKDLKVVGISWDENKKQSFAMVEDLSKQVTYFLREGDSVLNLVVKKVDDEGLILMYGQEEVTLK